MTALSRRRLIGRAASAAALAAVPSTLVAAEAALAQDADSEADETAAVERLIGLEQAAALACSLAAESEGLGPESREALERFARHNGEHATALEEALDQLGEEPPEQSDEPADYESLAGFDPEAAEREQLEFLADLELELVAAYGEETVGLDAPDLVRTAAQVGAAHAQQLVAMRLLARVSAAALTDLEISPA